MTVYYQFNILSRKNLQFGITEWQGLPNVRILPEGCLQDNRFHSDLIVQLGPGPYNLYLKAFLYVAYCIRHLCSKQMCLMCSLIKVQHGRGKDLNEKFYWKLSLWLACQRETASQGLKLVITLHLSWPMTGRQSSLGRCWQWQSVKKSL